MIAERCVSARGDTTRTPVSSAQRNTGSCRTRAYCAMSSMPSSASMPTEAEDPLGHVIELELELLESARSIDRRDFARAVGLLAKASRVLAFGLGPTGPLAEYFALRLVRFG